MTLTPQGGKRSPSAYLPLSTLSPRETWSLSENEEEEREEEEEEEPIISNKILIYQYTALICACLIGTGSHFANHTIGPLKPYLKEELGLDNTHFGTLQASLSLLSTLTPLVGGWMADQVGIGPSAVLSSFLVLLGQTCVAIGVEARSFVIVLLGYCIQSVGSGGVIPVLESMLSRTYDHHHLSTTLGFYLSFGKLVSFMAAGLALPLRRLTGGWTGAVFWLSTLLCLLSFLVACYYTGRAKHSPKLPTTPPSASPLSPIEPCSISPTGRSTSSPGEASLETEDEDEMLEQGEPSLPLTSILTVPVIWYLVITYLLGACWTPFLHLSTTIFTEVQGVPEETAAWLSSSILALPILGNPPSATLGPVVAILSALCMALALSCTPLALVAVASTLRTHRVGLLLGLHRVVDMSGSVGMSVGAGLLQDAQGGRYRPVLETWTILGFLGLAAALSFPVPLISWDGPGRGVRVGGILFIATSVLLAWTLFLYGSFLHSSLGHGDPHR
ncbi:major facilitator superfamily domain-containing protein [Piptocephalis cylindrospora]|uniref:Lysosomal dipeptide transporter MFSD1 n=1 Tax=Piptocephalis cylindrospora TaxID=1907219 RepID=A0A4P9Y2P6_9FUNG|nr:major facilitator superfamily domain-containing protein [Piptocephalis cylindrospora]|eukprot:RKP13186.1 major facilitator superfamily domain-containing protein [Piptocephalis cylindrospora]